MITSGGDRSVVFEDVDLPNRCPVWGLGDGDRHVAVKVQPSDWAWVCFTDSEGKRIEFAPCRKCGLVFSFRS